MVGSGRAPTDMEGILLDYKSRGDSCREFEEALYKKIRGQDPAVMAMSALYQTYRTGFWPAGRPIGSILCLGPTGSGKTRLIEATADILYGTPSAVIKVDCGEFQHSHEIAKLIGSPPGYLGHRETQPLLTQENLDQYHDKKRKLELTLLLFDEIEKASDALWQLLLGILDKATLTLGDIRRVNLGKCIIVLTSNLGSREMLNSQNRIGFKPLSTTIEPEVEFSHLNRVAIEAVKKRFSPEFMNRLSKIIVFHKLSEERMREILELELDELQSQLLTLGVNCVLTFTNEVKGFLLIKSLAADPHRDYGAREIKRAIDRYIREPLSNLIDKKLLNTGDWIVIDVSSDKKELEFSKMPGGAGLGQLPSDSLQDTYLSRNPILVKTNK